MSHLIVGHVTTTTARIWVRGRLISGEARLRFRIDGSGNPWENRTAALEPYRDYTAIVELTGLQPATPYECELSFANGSPPPVRTGRFKTAPATSQDLSFLLASCCFSKLQILNSKNVVAAWTRIGQLAGDRGADFMVHCGDQIYADLLGEPDPTLRSFQEEYKKAWAFRPAARVLAQLPHYMILDDHEIFDNFANDASFGASEFGGPPVSRIRDFGLEAYRQYQHSHNPQTVPPPALHYAFDFAGAFFFAFDCRSERWAKSDTQMISNAQMAAFKSWLSVHAPEPKFVITSIPFVGEVRGGEGADKWCGDPFRAQREEILDHLAANGIGRICFLTGDMHCSYHAQMRVTPTGAAAAAALTIHELMSSPINQVTSGTHSFIDRPERMTAAGTRYQTLPFAPTETYTAHSNVMAVRFSPNDRSVNWQIYRTKDESLPPVPVVAGQFGL